MPKDKKFTDTDRDLVIKELERIQKVKLVQVKPSRRFFKDETGKCYCILGGREDWHGLSKNLMTHLEQSGKDTVLVIAKKYRSRIDVCVAEASDLVVQKNKLLKTNNNGFQFHTVLAEEGLYIEEIPEIYLKKVSEIFYENKDDPLKGLFEIKKVINIDLQNDDKSPSADQDEELTHTDIQAKIILIGNFLGYRTYTPDKARQSKYGILGELASEKDVPSDYVPPRQIETVRNIDVIWLDEDGLPTHCFEVEHTTDITKGLLRLYQIRKLRIKMFIIAEDSSKKKFETEIKKDPFYHVKEEYFFRTYMELDGFLESVKRFTTTRTSFLNEN